MRKALKIIAVILLLLNGIGALYGGLLLMIDPQGKLLQLPFSLLDHTPFRNFFIPGLILFIFNGCLCIAAVVMVIRNSVYYPWMVILQGFILGGWILIEIIMIRTWFTPLHLPYLIIAVAMIISGVTLLRMKQVS